MVTDLNPDVRLTYRQECILEYIALGYAHKEIADILNVKTDTVSAHVKIIKEKTRAQKASELSIVWFCRLHNITIKELIAKRVFPMILFILLSSISIFNGIDASRTVRTCRSGRRTKSEILFTI